jgi:RNA polymerase sigma-70 factor (ECF subfamily)
MFFGRAIAVELGGPDPHLSQIETQWTLVLRARGGADPSAQSAVLERYRGAVFRYLLASLRDREAASDLAQEFALRLLRGDFRNADPGRGRFRDYVKRVVYHLMVDHHRARRDANQPAAVEAAVADPADDWARDHDRQFLESWRAELLARAWAELDQLEARTGQPFASVLRTRVEEPDLHSPELAERVGQRLGRPLTAGWVRQNLHRSRDIFVELLLDQVTRSLEDPTPDRVEEELAELDLLERCRPALRRLRAQ